jgi:hypothetical protein
VCFSLTTTNVTETTGVFIRSVGGIRGTMTK